MDATFDGDIVRAGVEGRERFYDSRGYGRPVDDGIELAPVEAAHLLFRGDLAGVTDRRSDSPTAGEQLDFHDILASAAVSEVAFFVYKELRDRGFYLSPARDGWIDAAVVNVSDGVDAAVADSATGGGSDDGTTVPVDFVVYPRGNGPWDGEIAYHVRVVSERASVGADLLLALARIDEGTGVLAVVDEESEVTYLETVAPTISGSTHHDLDAVEGELLSDRVLVWDPPSALHDRAFYGQRLDRDDEPVQLSLVEAAYLARLGVLELAETDDDTATLVERGRAVEGERFDRRLRAYSALRTAGVVPKTGFKFGADFRTYADVDSVEHLGHSELLVRVLPSDHRFDPRDLALDVRLAHGVRKRMIVALTDVDEGIDWLAVERLTP